MLSRTLPNPKVSKNQASEHGCLAGALSHFSRENLKLQFCANRLVSSLKTPGAQAWQNCRRLIRYLKLHPGMPKSTRSTFCLACCTGMLGHKVFIDANCSGDWHTPSTSSDLQKSADGQRIIFWASLVSYASDALCLKTPWTLCFRQTMLWQLPLPTTVLVARLRTSWEQAG